ncbi:MAG: RNA methyltransferase [Gaiellaceae bacterium]
MITSAHNPKLRLIRRLLTSRRQREREGLFVCEGEDLLEAGRSAGVEPVDVLVAGEDVDPGLLAELSTLGHPPRVISVFRRDALPVGYRDVVLALWHVADPGNVGTLLRAADAFGASVALSQGCADPTGPRALRASAGAIFRVPLGRFDEAPGRRIGLDANAGQALGELDLAPPLVLVLGAEREGLGALEGLEPARIPMPGDAESLNVAMAGAIALYEQARHTSATGSDPGTEV